MEDTNFDVQSALDTISSDLFGAESETPSADDGGTEVDVAVNAAAEETAAQVPDGEEKTPEPTPAAPSPEPAAPVEPALAAPKTWRQDAAAEWANIPPKAQAEILKREEDIFRGLEGYKADANVGRTVNQIVAPYLPALRAAGIDPLRQVSDIMRTHHALSTGSAEQKQLFFQKLAEQYSVNLGGEMPYVDPQVAALQNELNSLKSRIADREGRDVEAARASLSAEIDAFASLPENQYFDEVAGDIAGLLRSGAAKNLKDAYDKAVWANPATRAKEQTRLANEAVAKAEAERAAHAKEAAKAAQANVRSRARSASAAAPKGTIEDTLATAMREIRSRAT